MTPCLASPQSPSTRRLTRVDSPITTATVASSGVTLTELRAALPQATRCHHGPCTTEVGRGDPHTGNTNGPTPETANVRSAVHEYGGGAIQAPSSDIGVGFRYAYDYPPTNLHSALQADPEFAPPLLVKAHGGPTARTSTTFRLDVQFWTSRGFAVLDVDYGGSTGYGKAYRQSLLGNWGLLDVDDVKHAALYCVLQKKANANWICIDGRSAGGYTTLAALTFTNTFRAGASLYGIGDLSLLADETHKFESRYLEGLIGPYPEAKEMFDARCPILHLDQLTCPAILLQGDEDKVVPPSQAETMYAAHRKKGLPSTLILYKGEQHGFRQSNHISHALLSEYSFFCQTFGFELQQEGDFKGIKIGERVEIE